jgi:hypothetical protein
VENFPSKIFSYGKFSAIFFQNIFRFLKSSLNISFFNLFLVALGLNEIAVTVDIAEYRNKEKFWSRNVIWRAAENMSPLTWWKGYCRTRHLLVHCCNADLKHPGNRCSM